MQIYGYGWFWSPMGDGRSVYVPPSTAYPTPPLNWWHKQGCDVDPVYGTGCTCVQEGKKD